MSNSKFDIRTTLIHFYTKICARVFIYLVHSMDKNVDHMKRNTFASHVYQSVFVYLWDIFRTYPIIDSFQEKVLNVITWEIALYHLAIQMFPVCMYSIACAQWTTRIDFQ